MFNFNEVFFVVVLSTVAYGWIKMWMDIHNFAFNGSTDAVGGGASHENRSPYYGFYYIIKI